MHRFDCLLALLAFFAASASEAATGRLVVLAFDGLDYGLAKAWIEQGRLPAFAEMARQNGLARVAGDWPCDSAAAWAAALWGQGPDYTGIFGESRRGPARYASVSSVLQFPGDPGGAMRPESPMPPGALWDRLGAAGVPTAVLHSPFSFPLDPAGVGWIAAGAPTPDMPMGQAEYALYTTAAPMLGGAAPGAPAPRRIFFRGDQSEIEIEGPWNPDARAIWGQIEQRRSGELERLSRATAAERPAVIARLGELDAQLAALAPSRFARATVEIERLAFGAGLEMRGGGRREWLRPGDWSGWFELDFDLPGGGSVRGLCQFLLLDLPGERGAGEMHLLRSPVRMHPAAPAWPISRPATLANDLATSAGLFAAGGEGWAAQALQDERMSDEAFLARLRDSMESRERRLRAMFDHGEWAFLLAAFDEVFWIERMMWRTGDPAHPRYSAAESESAAGAILDAYRRADSIAARTLERLRPGDRLIVFSPFGCAPFYRWINLNNALLQGGFLRRLDPGRPASEMRAFAGADWAASQAYALGAGQIYLNLQGREPGGSVPPGDQADALKREIADYLLGLVDPETGEKPVARVMDAAREFPGPKAEAGPDLLVAFRRGWRDDWLSPHGSLAEGVFGENRRRWSADYSMVEPETAPGLTLSSDPLERERLSPMDLAPAALEWFGVAKPEATRGRGF